MPDFPTTYYRDWRAESQFPDGRPPIVGRLVAPTRARLDYLERDQRLALFDCGYSLRWTCTARELGPQDRGVVVEIPPVKS